jgi:hypothetical protein
VKDFCEYDLHDACVEKIEINSNKTVLHVDADGLKMKIVCSDTVGVTDICMWEDDIIYDVKLSEVKDFSVLFLSEVKKAHGASNKSTVKKGLLDLSVELVNNIAMHIYCYNLEVER